VPNYLHPFTADQLAAAEIEVKRLGRALQGRKLEEGDWTDLYCQVKGAPSPGWSNLPFRDYVHNGVGVEFKLLCRPNPAQDMGRALMHPSATRTINFDESGSAAAATKAVLEQWGAQIERFCERIASTSEAGTYEARWGVLLWAPDHSQFLYFEESLTKPNPRDFEGRWVDGSHRNKPTRNLHIFERETQKKRYSCTLPRNGAKLQPYFDVPTVEQGAVLFNVPPLTMAPLYVEHSDLERMRHLFPGAADEEIAAKLLAFYLEHREADVIIGNPPYSPKRRE
jgi:hypothetical protein